MFTIVGQRRYAHELTLGPAHRQLIITRMLSKFLVTELHRAHMIKQNRHQTDTIRTGSTAVNWTCPSHAAALLLCWLWSVCQSRCQ